MVIPGILVHGYLARLGLAEPPPATLDGLRLLHAAHLRRIPFENLSIHLGEEIVLDPAALVEKVVDRRRGGFCYELNGALATLLRALGFEVTLLAARVFDDQELGPAFDHMCLRVDLDEPWLVDVGFGDSFHQPLRLRARSEQDDPAGSFRLADAPGEQLDLLRDGEPQYRFDLTPRVLTDYEATCRYHQTSPDSHFTRNPVCSIATADGRVTIRGDLLVVTDGGRRTERRLATEELTRAYREHFGIDLGPDPFPARETGR